MGVGFHIVSGPTTMVLKSRSPECPQVLSKFTPSISYSVLEIGLEKATKLFPRSPETKIVPREPVAQHRDPGSSQKILRRSVSMFLKEPVQGGVQVDVAVGVLDELGLKDSVWVGV